MAQQAKLTAQRRTHAGRNAIKKIKAEGLVPAVIYGAKQDTIKLQVPGRELSEVFSRAAGENILVQLEILDGDDKTNTLALIQEVQHHPLKKDILHVDFQAISATEKMIAEVAIVAVGEAVGVRTYGGLLEHILRSFEVECYPKDLPEVIEVDVSNLNVGDSLHVKDLPLPEGVVAVTDAEQTVVAVVEPRVEAEEPVAAEAVTAPEVITEKKEEEPKPESSQA
ncbi:MAG: 50S ribosomal protein L25/general stress protein Ctc [Chthoniobacterales bacterium]|jgi:large subunit ribosomal protein L25